MIRLRLEIAGEVQLDRAITRFTEGVADYRPVWPAISDDFRSLERRQFATEGAAGGGERWAALTAAYARWKAVRFPGKPILQRTGRLVGSLTDRSHPDAIEQAERMTLSLGTRVQYGLYHQRGTPRMQQRRGIQFTEAFKRAAMAHVQGYLVEMATRGGWRLKNVRNPDFAGRKLAAGRGRWD